MTRKTKSAGGVKTSVRAKTAKRAPTAKPKARPAKKKAAKRKPAAVKPKPAAIRPLDLSSFPPESVLTSHRWLCLACVADVFLRHMSLAPRTAALEIKRYTPSIAELYAPVAARPWFEADAPREGCPYCGSPVRWHTRFTVHRIESGKATDALRRALLRSLPQTGDQFAVLEEKATQQHAFFEWLEKISAGLDLDNPVWLRDVSLHYLSRKEPKTDWQALFTGIHGIRRSRRLDEGWEIDGDRLFLAPHLFDELLLAQYLVSRSHRAGGLTLEGRYTLPELFVRLRNAGYLRAAGVHAQNPGDALEELVTYLGGGESPVKFHHLVDRRDLLQKVKSLDLAKPPKPKPR
jgi:hypothetical protein